MENSNEILKVAKENEESTIDSMRKDCWYSMCGMIRTGRNYLFNRRFGRLVFRFVPLFTSLWTFVDVGLDTYQATIYYEYSTIGIENCIWKVKKGHLIISYI